jgi:formylglycine-generating enzyme required for sulfatase activity
VSRFRVLRGGSYYGDSWFLRPPQVRAQEPEQVRRLSDCGDQEETMKRRVIRGGSCNNGTWSLRTTFRYGSVPEVRVGRSGFRIVVVRRKP